MYLKDEFTNNSNDDLPSFPRELMNASKYCCINSSNFNKFLPNTLNSNFEPFNSNNNNNNLTTLLNPTNNSTSSESNNTEIINTMLCSENNQLGFIVKGNDNNDNSNNDADNNNNEEQEIRRLKRMLSNRDSARRSRLRKRKQLETLQNQVCHLLTANYQLAEKLNQVMEANYQILQENAQLRQDAALLQKNVTDMIVSMNNAGLEEGSTSGCNNLINNGGGGVIRVSQAITSENSLDVLK